MHMIINKFNSIIRSDYFDCIVKLSFHHIIKGCKHIKHFIFCFDKKVIPNAFGIIINNGQKIFIHINPKGPKGQDE